jgi:mannitol-1-phosphate/altronate dehydrogenase
VLDKVMSENPEPLTEAEAPQELAAIVMQALEKEPEKRYQRMIEMLQALMKFMQGWDRQTRELALKTCERYQENAKLIAAKGMTEDVAAVPFLKDLPMFQDRGADVLKVMPFRRARILEIAKALDEQRARLMS